MDTPTYPLNDINNHIASQIDVFICCASFESRCLAVPKHLDTARIRRSLIAKNSNNEQFVGENTRHLQEMLGKSAEIVEHTTDDPFIGADNFMRVLSRLYTPEPQTIVVDITTFTRESLLILILLLRKTLKHTDRVQFLYVAAERYSPPAVGDEKETLWLSKGIKEIRSVLGYSGEYSPTRRLHLIVLVGFEYERTLQLIESYEPALVSLGFSEDATMPDHREKNKEFYLRIKSLYGNPVEDFLFSATDPMRTKQAIIQQYEKYKDHNTILSPMNTKISTLGAALAGFDEEAIQICYAQAETYNIENYSKPRDSFYIFESSIMDFASR